MKTLKFICMPVSGNGGIETVLVKVLNYLAQYRTYAIELYLTSIPDNDLWLTRMDSKVKINKIHSNNKLVKLLYLTHIFLHAKNDDHFIILGANIIPFASKMRFFLRKKYWITSWIHYSLNHQSIFDPYKLLKADDHWAISSAVKNFLQRMGVPSTSIHLIYNPIEKYNGPINKANMNSSEPRLVYVGRITLKGQKNLIELFKGVAFYNKHQKGNKIKVDLFGTQPNPQEINTAIDHLGLRDNIYIHNWTADPWKPIINDIHPKALVMTSAFEGLPMVSLEAMSRGIPCLLSSFDGANDVVTSGVNGFIYHQQDTNDFYNKLTQLLNTNFDSYTIAQSIDKFYYNNYFKRLIDVLGCHHK